MSSGRLALVASLALHGCGTGDTGSGSPVTDASAPDAAEGPPNFDIDAPWFATPLPAGAEFTLGQAREGALGPPDFRPLTPGAELAIVRGSQGLFMVALAVRTRGVLHGKSRFRLDLRAGDRRIRGPSGLETELVPEPGGDGYDYLFNWFIILDPAVAGHAGRLVVWAWDADGHGASAQSDVEFGQPQG